MPPVVYRFLLWTGAAGLVLLLLTEAVLWLAFPAKPVTTRVSLTNEIPGLKPEVDFVIDERSTRSWSTKGGAREVSVLVLGGGATAAVLQNDQDTWWGQLGERLQKEFPSASFKVTAFSREGTGILPAAKWAEKNVPDIKPDVVIAIYGFDDIVLHPPSYTYDANRIASTPDGSQQRTGLKKTLYNTSQLVRRFSDSRKKAGIARAVAPWRTKNAYLDSLKKQRGAYAALPLKYEVERPEGKDPLQEYLDGIKSLAASAKGVGAAFVVVGEPTLHNGLMGQLEERLVHRWYIIDAAAAATGGVVRLDSGWLELELGRYFTAAEKLCGELGVTFFNPQRKVPASAQVFVDDTMFTDPGAAGFATLLLPVVKPAVAEKVK